MSDAAPGDPEFQLEPASHTLFDEMRPLLRRHWAEVSEEPGIELGPRFDRYLQAHDQGILKIFTARQCTELVGYAAFFVQPHLHALGSLQAAADAFYLAPPFRQGWAGYRFLQHCDHELARAGVTKIMHAVTPRHDWSSLLFRAGYEVEETIWSRRPH